MLPVYLLYGAPTSGKGTICKKFPLAYVISMGQLLRQHKMVQGGELADTLIVNDLLETELNKRKSLPYVILDGYPRTKEQCDFIKSLKNISIEKFIHLTCSDENVIFRTQQRESCPCGASYMPVLKPSIKKGICDLCGQKLFRRPDDDQELVKKRLQIYHQETNEIIQSFQDIYIEINMNTVKKFHQAPQIIAQINKQHFGFLLNEKTHT